MKSIFVFPFKILSLFFGSIRWIAPAWIKSLLRFQNNRPIVFWPITLIIAAFAIGLYYYQTQPTAIMITANITAPRTTPLGEESKPEPLLIHFVYDLKRLHPEQDIPQNNPSVARIDLAGEIIPTGIKLSPAKKGIWEWLDDKSIQFTPETDWPAGTSYLIDVENSIFSESTHLSATTYKFKTIVLSSSIETFEFYQNPADSATKQVAATINFSHPIDKNSLKENIQLQMRPSNSTKDAESEDYDFDINYSNNLRQAYVLSKPIELPKQANTMTLTLADGINTLLGGKPTENTISAKVLIPDMYSFLKVTDLSTHIIRNDENNPEQVLSITFSDRLSQEEVINKLDVYLLPKRDDSINARSITKTILNSSKKLPLTLIPNAQDASTHFNFIFDAPDNRLLYIKMNKGFTSVNQFVHQAFYDEVLIAPEYPKEIQFSGDGNILTTSGNHQIGTITRGISSIEYSVGKLLNNQIYHLVSQTGGSLNDDSFYNWRFNKNNLASFQKEYIDLKLQHPKQPNYSSLDLTQYLDNQPNNLGVFFVEAKGWDKKNNLEIHGANDSRLILITDLGIIVKDNADHSHDIFVQSIATGKPVAGATIELLGKNGVPLISNTTSSKGHATLPATHQYNKEKTPVVYIVKTDNDIAFIPYNQASRQINLSRFDIGGISTNNYYQDSLNAYGFSDRGIYRPGEVVNIGFIIKNNNLSNVEDIPLEMVIRGPKQNQVTVKRVSLAKNGFMDFQYPTTVTSDTGAYQASMHLVRDNQRRGRILGSTQFTVEEFQPDTLTIKSELNQVNNAGWITDEKITANVTLSNLFGTPAQNRKVTGKVVIKPTRFLFKAFDQYQFTDPYINSENTQLHMNEELAEQQTDASGKAQLTSDLSRFREGTYSVELIIEGFDQAGGRGVLAVNRALISPLPYLVGYKADGKLDYINTDSKRTINLIAIDANTKTINIDSLTLKTVEIQKVSTLVKQRDGRYLYQTVNKESVLDESPINIRSEGLSYLLNSKQPGDFVLDISDNKGQHLARIPYTVVGSGNLAGKIDKSAELQLALNKNDYRAGDTIEMSIKAPYAGSGLITIESDKVHHFQWFTTKEESTIESIQIPDSLEGNAYINVAFMRDIYSKNIFSSPLSYAVKPFSIDKSARQITIDLATDSIVRPGKAMNVKYRTSKNAKIAIFAVDKGILQIANYQTPDPLGYFLQKRALDVDTLQMLDLILPDFDIIKRLSASGGGAYEKEALAKNLNPFARKTDKPAVFWSGIINASTQEKNLTIDIPDTFSGSLEVMAVAVNDNAMGATKTSTLVRGPFVISPTVLTQAAPGDEFIVTVGVANLIKNSGKSAQIDIQATSSEHIEILDALNTTLSIDEGSEAHTSFKVKAKNILGAATLKFTARYKDEQLSRSSSLSIRPATPYYSLFNSGFSSDKNTTLAPTRTLYPNFAEQRVSASKSPLVLVNGLTAYLENYPHGCTEQVVSQAFPIIGLITHPSYTPDNHKVQTNVDAAITKLRERQQADGGFAFWPGNIRSAQYPTIYAMHFLIEAQALGYPIPNDILYRGQQYLLDYVARPVNFQQGQSLVAAREMANAIYLLSRMGIVTTNYLVDLETALDKSHKKQWKKDLLASYIAATYKLLEKTDIADTLINHYTLGQHKKNLQDDFHSPLAQDAQHLFLLAKHFSAKAKALNGDELFVLTDKIFKGEYNTLSSAYSVLALGAYSTLVLNNSLDENIRFIANHPVNKDQILDIQNNPFPSSQYATGIEKIDIKSDAPFYYLNLQSGFDANKNDTPINQGLEIIREFSDNNGKKLTQFEQGKEITVTLKIRALENKTLTNIAIIDLLPGGFEVVRHSVKRTAPNWRADHIDTREDRVIYYGRFNSSVTTLTYRVKLTTAGDFIVPPAYAESMYDRSIRATSVAGRFEVTPSK